MPDVGPMLGGGEDDPLVGEFAALREAVAEQVRAVARLEVALGQVRGEVARKTGPELFKETFAALRQEVGAVGEQLARQEAALRQVPGAAAIGAAVKEGTGGLAEDMSRTRVVVQNAAKMAQEAAEQAREMTRAAFKHAQSLREMALSERTRLVLTLAGGLVMASLGLSTGWGLRGWWAPPPAGVFARYLAAGNEAEWLLCAGGGKRFMAQNGVAACELRFWLERAGP
jgi:hypothetical protein